LNEYAVGGLIYFSQNILDRDQITEMLSNTTSMSKYPIFLAVDEEGGSVSRVANSDIDVIQVDDMATIGATEDTTQAYEAGVTIGAYLSEIGFNVDFAPVSDVVSEDGSSALQDRSFGSDAQLVSDMVSNVVDGIEGTGVSSCLKHFPGIGSASEDTHDGRVEIDKTLDEMRQTDFLPFQAGIDAGADFVMVSHATASQIDEDGLPSSLSSTIMTDILRDELNFEGVIITDALNMSAITDYYTSAEAAVKAIQAGADMLLMPEDFKEAYDAVLAAVQDGTISEDRIDDSLRRIYRIKYADKLEQ
jgi:beta-N-acetylhexosaminidase